MLYILTLKVFEDQALEAGKSEVSLNYKGCNFATHNSIANGLSQLLPVMLGEALVDFDNKNKKEEGTESV